jgi:prepilin-type N-terminal cleavage/methylation domain-containing protein
MLTKRNLCKADRRAGFTLVELIVVLTIIILLVALGTSAVVRVMASQQSSVTETTMKKLHRVLLRQWTAVVDQAKQEPLSSDVIAMAGGDARRARVIWIKLRLRQEFPTSFDEIRNPINITNTGFNVQLPSRATYVKAIQTVGTNPPPPNYESAICLLMALSQERRGVKFNPDDLSATEVQTISGLKAPIDAWGQPFAFFRFPTGDPDVRTPNAQTRINDVLDPDGTLLNSNWNNAASSTTPNAVFWFEKYLHTIHTGAGTNYAPVSYHVGPVIVSAGPNKKLALDALMTPQGSDANDNLYSYRLFPEGARGD